MARSRAGRGTQAHGAISATIVALVRSAVPGGPCRVYTADVKVRMAERRFLYPDVSVGCDPTERREEADELAAPRLVVEVLSESTAAHDRGRSCPLPSGAITSGVPPGRCAPTGGRGTPAAARRERDDDHHRRRGRVTLLSMGITVPVAAPHDDVDVPATSDEPCGGMGGDRP
jgi:hypothetical protein